MPNAPFELDKNQIAYGYGPSTVTVYPDGHNDLPVCLACTGDIHLAISQTPTEIFGLALSLTYQSEQEALDALIRHSKEHHQEEPIIVENTAKSYTLFNAALLHEE
jgi:hypothetical protein